jgi:polyisoprenoid-binding protein YceI
MAACGPAVADSWRSSGEGDSLTFVTSWDGQPLEGRFRTFKVRVDTQEPEQAPAALIVQVETTSADMNDKELNAALGDPDWFDSTAYPAANFTTDRIERTGENQYRATGKLELKGQANGATVHFDWHTDGATATLTGTAELSRSSWRVGSGEWSGEEHIPDAVQVRFNVTLARTP